MREAMPRRLIMLTTQMRLMPQMAGSADVEQHQARWRSNITFSPSEPSGVGSSITRCPCDHSPGSACGETSTPASLLLLFLHDKREIAVSYLLDVLCYEAAAHLLVIGDEEEGLSLRGTLGLHLLEAQVVVHHLPDLLHLRNKQLPSSRETTCSEAEKKYHLVFVCTAKIKYPLIDLADQSPAVIPTNVKQPF